jgi:hypothetical protein
LVAVTLVAERIVLVLAIMSNWLPPPFMKILAMLVAAIVTTTKTSTLASACAFTHSGIPLTKDDLVTTETRLQKN